MADRDEAIQNVLKTLPDAPGVYLFYTKQRTLVYVGKATSLKSRVSSYFKSGRASRPIEHMLHEVVDVKWRITASALEAAILESVYIKKYQPKYNVLGKDNKSWNYLLITKTSFPTLVALRQHSFSQLTEKEIASRYSFVFGPFPGLNTREALKILRKVFLFSTCQTGRFLKNKKTAAPCLYRQMGLCLGVCTGEITSREYARRVVRPLALFLSGKTQAVLRGFERDMQSASKKEDFERAATLRNQLQALSRIQDVALINESFTRDLFDKSTVSRISRIEGYDISHFGGKDIVGSMVVFDSAGPVLSEYRRFALRGFTASDDIGSLSQVLDRRLKHSEWILPDIFLIDGGAAQIRAAALALERAGVRRPVVGIAKGPERKRNDMRITFPFLVDGTQQASWLSVEEQRACIRDVQQLFSLFLRVRDEAHRFAVSYQRKKRRIQK